MDVVISWEQPTLSLYVKSQPLPSRAAGWGGTGSGKQGHLPGFDVGLSLSATIQNSYVHISVMTPHYVNGGTVVRAAPSQQDDCGFDSRPGAFLFGVRMIQLCLCGFSLCM